MIKRYAILWIETGEYLQVATSGSHWLYCLYELKHHWTATSYRRYEDTWENVNFKLNDKQQSIIVNNNLLKLELANNKEQFEIVEIND